MVEQQSFDLVITDAVMPGMSGPQLIEHLRDGPPRAAVLLMSGYTPDESAERRSDQRCPGSVNRSRCPI